MLAAAVTAPTHVFGQVLLVPSIGPGPVDVQEGDDLTLDLFLQSVPATTDLAGAGLIVSVPENAVGVLFNGSGSVFPGGLPLIGPLLGDQDLNIGAFAAPPITVDDSGTDLLGTLTIQSASLTAGDQFTIDFDRTILSGSTGAEVQTLPNPLLVTIVPVPVIGDLNGDGSLTNGDIAPFVLALTDPDGYAQAFPDLDPDVLGDFDSGGTLTNGDIAGFVDALTGPSALASVPEPGSALLLGLAGMVVVRRRR